MKAVLRESNGSVIGGFFKNGEIYEGTLEECQDWIEDIECSLEGDTYISEPRSIPHGTGQNITIYGETEEVHIWVDTARDEDGEELYIFGQYDSKTEEII